MTKAEGRAPQIEARIAGALYLGIIVGALFSEMIVRDGLVDYQDAAATARSIMASETLWRLGFATDFGVLLCDIGVSALLYVILRPAGQGLALATMLVRLISIAINGGNLILHLAPVQWLHNAGAFASFTPEQVQTVALAAIKLHGQIYNISLGVFGAHCVLLGWLLLRARFLPWFLGALLALAGVCYLFNSFAIFLALPFRLTPYSLLPCFIGEAALTLWLLIAGVNGEKWRAQAAA